MIHLDTNFLIYALQPGSSQERRLFEWRSAGEAINLSAIVWTEYLCGPVSADDVRRATNLFPNPEPFLPVDSPIAAEWFNQTGRRRGSIMDCMVAAVSYRAGARLATENTQDFRLFVSLGLSLA